MGAADKSLADDAKQCGMDRLFLLKVEGGRRTLLAAMNGQKIMRCSEFAAGLTDEIDLITDFLEGLGGDVCGIIDSADHGDGRGRINGPCGAFVVEADIAPGDGHAKCPASLGDTLHSGAELVKVLGLVRVAKV